MKPFAKSHYYYQPKTAEFLKLQYLCYQQVVFPNVKQSTINKHPTGGKEDLCRNCQRKSRLQTHTLY